MEEKITQVLGGILERFRNGETARMACDGNSGYHMLFHDPELPANAPPELLKVHPMTI